MTQSVHHLLCTESQCASVDPGCMDVTGNMDCAVQIMQGEREHDSNKVERTSEEKPSWWSKLPFWREEQSAVDAAEAEARREASSLCRQKICKPVFCHVHLRTAMPASLSCFAVYPSLFNLVTRPQTPISAVTL